MSILSSILGVESGGRNITQGNIGDINNQTGDLAQGFFQITGGTWSQFGGLNTGFGSAISAPYQTQLQVAENIPVARWGPATQSALASAGYTYAGNETLGQLMAAYGESSTGNPTSDLTGAVGGTSGGISMSVGPADNSGIASTDGSSGNSLGYPALGIGGSADPSTFGTPALTQTGLNAGTDYYAPGTFTQLPAATVAAGDVQAAGFEKGSTTTATATNKQTAANIGIVGSLEQFLSNAFVVFAIAVLGVIFVAFGLGLFNKKTMAGVLA